MKPTDTPDREQHVSPVMQRSAAYLAAVLLGGLFGLAVVVVGVRLWSAASLPIITAEAAQQARERWEQSEMMNYNIEVAVTGRQAARYRVVVRNGQPQSATRDAQPLKQQRTWSTWTVEGMFETMQRDLSAVALHAAGEADRNTPQLQLRGTFHPEWGYPMKYHRLELKQFGANDEVTWEVVRFERTE